VIRRVLVVDDEQGIRAALGQLLEYEGYAVETAATGEEGLAAYTRSRADLVFLDVKMAGMDGLETLQKLRQADPTALVVMISGHATLQMAVQATQLGAYDVLDKPLDTDRVLVLLRNALERVALREENELLRGKAGTPGAIVGESFAIRALREQITRVAGTGARVLITGENGTGKELVARAVHLQSPRAAKPFVEVNCAAIPSELIESELFGHVRGSFTGAVADRAGKFEQADGGTLFLDEIGDMAAAAQAKVLRALQDGAITRIGGTTPVQVDVRVLAATNKKLDEEIQAGRL
jgi:two-component system nitrogen regulation response regulator NtrX